MLIMRYTHSCARGSSITPLDSVKLGVFSSLKSCSNVGSSQRTCIVVLLRYHRKRFALLRPSVTSVRLFQSAAETVLETCGTRLVTGSSIHSSRKVKAFVVGVLGRLS